MKRNIVSAVFAASSLLSLSLPGSLSAAEPLQVVVDIAPVNSLVKMVLGDRGRTKMLLVPGADPHHSSLRPSDAKSLSNADVIFSEENLNKIEAGYGKSVRESLEDMLYRIETGRNRPTGQNAQVNNLMNYLNGSVGTVMFFNMRSALLQQMSIVNYINFADNNIFDADIVTRLTQCLYTFRQVPTDFIEVFELH